MSQLTVSNNWESLTWDIDGENVTNSLKNVTLQFPDGTVEKFKVSWTKGSVSYNDMGHTYSATQYNAFIELNVNGLKLKINLKNIASDVDIVKYKVKKK